MSDEPTMTVPTALFQNLFTMLALDGQKAQMMAQAQELLQQQVQKMNAPTLVKDKG